MVKLLCSGCVSWLAFPLKDLVAAIKLESKVEQIGITELIGIVSELTPASLRALKTNGCTPTHIAQTAGDFVVVPAGWVCCELATQGVLLYGVRRSFIPCGVEAQSNYEVLIGCHNHDSKATTKMQECLALMAQEDE